MGNTANRDMRLLSAEERKEEVLTLRGQRLTWAVIAEKLGCAIETARRDYLDALREAKERRLAAADVALDDEIETTEALRVAFMPLALAGDEKAASVVLRANAQLQQLKGLTTPQATNDKPQTLILTWGNTTTIHQHTGAEPPSVGYGEVIDIQPEAAPRLPTASTGDEEAEADERSA